MMLVRWVGVETASKAFVGIKFKNFISRENSSVRARFRKYFVATSRPQCALHSGVTNFASTKPLSTVRDNNEATKTHCSECVQENENLIGYLAVRYPTRYLY
jgi:hypothetical protein